MSTIKPPHLTREGSPWGVVVFIHTDGTEHRFYSVINDMSGNRLYAFDNAPPKIDTENGKESKKIFKRIHEKATVIRYAGSMGAPKVKRKKK